MIAALTGLFRARAGESMVLDVNGVGYLVYLPPVVWEALGDLQSELVADFFDGFAQGARANVHDKVLYGRSSHHQVEALFKAFARALRMACSKDRRLGRTMPSTKGLL